MVELNWQIMAAICLLAVVFALYALRRRTLNRVSRAAAAAEAEKARREQQLIGDMLREVSQLLNSTLDPDEVLRLIVDSTGCFAAHDRADIMLLENDGHTAYIHQHAPSTPETTAILKEQTFDYREYPVWAQAADGPVVVSDTLEHPGWRRVEQAMPIRSYASAPIRIEGQLTGFINLASRTPGAFTPEIADWLQVLADQAATALHNARLYDRVCQQAAELNQRVEALTLTQRVYKDVGLSLKVDRLLDIALDAGTRLCRADGGFIALMKDGCLETAHYYGNYQPDALDNLLAEKKGLIGQAVKQRRPLMTEAGDEVISALAGTKAQIALPLFSSNPNSPHMLTGLLALETARPERFTIDRFQLLGLLADRVASALDNARLVESVQAHAAQMELLYDRVSRLESIKSDMIRIAAHDLKNPLSVLLGYIGDLIDEAPDTPVGDLRRTHSAMQKAAERMRQIIQEILSLERIETMADQGMSAFDLRETVREAAAEFSERAAKKGQDFDVALPDKPCPVLGDPAQIREAAANFMSNAVKYTPEGGSITAALIPDGDSVRFEVRDTGPGIPIEQQKRLFEPFYRARETAAVEGSGLGLYLVKNIVERHGGSVIFDSVYGEGSRFGFELPGLKAADYVFKTASAVAKAAG